MQIFLSWLKKRSTQQAFLGIAIFLGIWILDGILCNGAFATDQSTLKTDLSNTITEYVSFANILVQMLYLILWPLLVVAWLALDNTLVYGSIFYLDAPLWKFWNMMKNFANFTLGFLVLYEVLKHLFSNGWANPKKIITNTLIAGVLIQVSWFLLAAVIDISTVMTYAVWGMPITILKSTELGNKKVLWFYSELDLDKYQDITQVNDRNGVVFYYTVKTADGGIANISPCRIYKQYIVGRQYAGFSTNENGSGKNSFMKWACVFEGNKVVRFENEIPYQELTNMPPEILKNAYDIDSNANTLNDYQYQALLSNALQSWYEKRSDRTQANMVFKISDDQGYCPDNRTRNDYGIMSIENREDKGSNTNAIKLSSIIDQAKGFQGPLMTLFASLLDFGSFTQQSKDVSERGVLFEVLIKVIFAAALLIPLILFAIILFVRVAVLWLIIAASPLYVLRWVFQDKLDWLDLPFGGSSPAGVLKVIFAPVITVFAVSVALIFMMAFKSGMSNCDTSTQSVNTRNNIDTALGIQTISDTGNNLRGIEIPARNTQYMIESKGDTVSGGLTTDTFGWIITNLFALGIVWMLFFAALKSTELGEKVMQKVWLDDDFAKNALGRLPIIPIPASNGGISFVGAQTATEGVSALTSKMSSDLENLQRSRMEEAFWTKEPSINPRHIQEMKKSLATGNENAVDTYLNNQSMDQEYRQQYSFTNSSFINQLSENLSGTALTNAAKAFGNALRNESLENANKMIEASKDTAIVREFIEITKREGKTLLFANNQQGKWDIKENKFV